MKPEHKLLAKKKCLVCIKRFERSIPLIIIFPLFFIFQIGCKRFVEVDGPITSTNSENVYTSDATAIAVLTGIYTTMSNSVFSSGGITSISLFMGLSADEFTLYSGVTQANYIAYYQNGLTNLNTGPSDFWVNTYPLLFMANSAIEGLSSSTALNPSIRLQLIGEAKFIRAFCFFYLVNMYGDIPLTVSTDYTVNSILKRSSKSIVYQQIITDLKDAEELLSSDYLDATLLASSQERVRPTKWSAAALLSRAYLYLGDYANAESQADTVINNSILFGLSNLDNVFLRSSLGNKEAIWQLQPVTNMTNNTQEALLFIIPSTGLSGNINPVYLNNTLLDSFEMGDSRKSSWINVYIDSTVIPHKNYYYAYKYKINNIGAPMTEYEMVLRLGEQYLIRSEARVYLGNITGAVADLNEIRLRAGLPVSNLTTGDSLLSAIQHERQVELFTEWGDRWLNLKRIEMVNATMSIVTPLKGGVWNSNWQLYPITLSDLKADPNLNQNLGY